MNSKPATIILYSFCYTRYEFQAPPISCMGVASAHTTRGQKSAVLYLHFDGHHFWQEATYSFKHGICEAEGLMCPLTKNKVGGARCFEMVIAWKVPKFGVLCEVTPFLKFAHIFFCLLSITSCSHEIIYQPSVLQTSKYWAGLSLLHYWQIPQHMKVIV